MENIKNETDQIQYQFTASPLTLMYILDSHCFKMLNLLIQEESYWRSKDKLDGGYFFKSISYLQQNMFMANEQDVRLTIEALYVSGLVDVINQGGNRKASKFRINIDKIIEINSMSIKDATNFYPRICKLKRGCVCSYLIRKDCTNDQNKEVDNVSDIDKVSESTTNCTTDCYTNCTTDCNTDCTPKLDKLYLLNKSDDNINNNANQYLKNQGYKCNCNFSHCMYKKSRC